MHDESGITNQDLLNAQYDQAVEAVRDKNYRVAVAIFEEHAALSQHNAQYNLALLLKKGLGKPQNYTHAFKWAWLARLGGVKKAEHLINELTDIIPEENHEDMRALVAQNLTDRIDAGDHRAITQYARYLTTALPEADYATAYKWYSVAAALKLPGGINGREAVYQEIDPADVMTLQNEALQLYEKVTSQN
jgi:TPR repeat protein